MQQATLSYPKKVDVVIVNDEADSPSLLNPMSGQIFVTNRVGRRVIELADGRRSVDEIADQVSREFKGAPVSRIRGDVDAFLSEAVGKGLVTWENGVTP